MNKEIDDILVKIGEEFGDSIGKGARNYLEVDIGRKADQLGRPEIGKRFHNVYAVVPLKKIDRWNEGSHRRTDICRLRPV